MSRPTTGALIRNTAAPLTRRTTGELNRPRLIRPSVAISADFGGHGWACAPRCAQRRYPRRRPGRCRRRLPNPAPGARITRPTSIANAGSMAINVPNAAVVSLRSAINSSANGTTGNRIARPIPISRISGVIRSNTLGPDHDRRHHTRDGHRNRQAVDACDLVADALGQQDVARPACGRGERVQHADRIDGALPRLGEQDDTEPPQAPATPDGPCPCRARPRRPTARGTPTRSRYPTECDPAPP